MKKFLKSVVGITMLIFGIFMIHYVLTTSGDEIAPEVENRGFLVLVVGYGIFFGGISTLLGLYFINQTLFYSKKWAVVINIGICIIFGIIGCIRLLGHLSVVFLDSYSVMGLMGVIIIFLIDGIWIKICFNTADNLMEKLKLMKERN